MQFYFQSKQNGYTTEFLSVSKPKFLSGHFKEFCHCGTCNSISLSLTYKEFYTNNSLHKYELNSAVIIWLFICRNLNFYSFREKLPKHKNWTKVQAPATSDTVKATHLSRFCFADETIICGKEAGVFITADSFIRINTVVLFTNCFLITVFIWL